MRNAIKEFIEPSSKEKNEVWKEALFVFDTNVLLNLYRYSKDTRIALFEAMKSLKGKLWLPHQVVQEFVNERYEVIFDTVERYETLISQNKKLISEIKNTLRLKDSDQTVHELENHITEWIYNKKSYDLLVPTPTDDQILEQLLEIFKEKIGRKYDESELSSIYEEGKHRYEKFIPPGYKDEKKNKKEENSGYGDLIIWKQIIEVSIEKRKSIVFITHDQKEDWWQIIKGKTIGPRVELKSEFIKETEQTLLMYSMNSFLEQIDKIGETKISENILEEVEEYTKNKMILSYIGENKEYDMKEIFHNISRIKYQIQKRENAILANQISYEKNPRSGVLTNIYNTQKKVDQYNKELETYYRKLQEMNVVNLDNEFIEFKY